ncbi:MAG: glycosyltransferase family 39 protein [Bacteroidales bacterium]
MERTNTGKSFFQRPGFLYLLAGLLLFPAYFINLGYMPLRFDGAFRGLIALEMILNEDYITPTINGIFYYNKPPLYNWILVLLFKLTGNYSEFMIRLPVVLSVFLMALTVFFLVKKYYNRDFAALNAFVFATGGAVLFGMSSVGMVDFTFAWLIYMSIMLIFHFYNKACFWRLFMVSYALTALAFLIKGLPAIAFQGITLMVFFMYRKDVKRLFSHQHLAGIVTLLAILGSYYLVYYLNNPAHLGEAMRRLFIESSIKSAAAYGIGDVLLHLGVFPFKTLYNLLPWTILGVFLIRRDLYRQLNREPLVRYSFWILIFNSIPYWISPGYQVKYLIPLFPLIFFLCLYFYRNFRTENPPLRRFVEYFFAGITLLFWISTVIVPLHPGLRAVEGAMYTSAILFLVFGGLFFLYLRMKSLRMQWFVVILLVARIGFNIILQPYYSDNLKETTFKERAITAGKITGDESLYLCTPINEDVSYYITRERMAVLPRIFTGAYAEDVFYIFDEGQVEELDAKGKEYKVFHKFFAEYQDKTLYLVKFLEQDQSKPTEPQ